MLNLEAEINAQRVTVAGLKRTVQALWGPMQGACGARDDLFKELRTLMETAIARQERPSMEGFSSDDSQGMV